MSVTNNSCSLFSLLISVLAVSMLITDSSSWPAFQQSALVPMLALSKSKFFNFSSISCMRFSSMWSELTESESSSSSSLLRLVTAFDKLVLKPVSQCLLQRIPVSCANLVNKSLTNSVGHDTPGSLVVSHVVVTTMQSDLAM